MPARQGKSEEIYKTDFVMNDFYKSYRQNSKKDKLKLVNRKQFAQIVYTYYEKAIRDLVLKNKSIQFGSRLGSLKVFKRQPSFFTTGDFDKIDLPIDYNATLKLWESDIEAKETKIIIRHTNDNSDGFIYFYKWYKKFAKVKNQNWYKFRATRTNKLFLSHEVKNNNVECFTMITS